MKGAECAVLRARVTSNPAPADIQDLRRLLHVLLALVNIAR